MEWQNSEEQTVSEQASEQLIREQIVELLKGGFAPNVILLREFSYDKAGIMLSGLHFSAWVLLGHIHGRHQTLLSFMKDPDNNLNMWPEAPWPENYSPASELEWNNAIDAYEKDLAEMITIVQDKKYALFQVQKNGKTISWAALTALHHTGYHIGQLKTIGRQLGVW